MLCTINSVIFQRNKRECNGYDTKEERKKKQNKINEET